MRLQESPGNPWETQPKARCSSSPPSSALQRKAERQGDTHECGGAVLRKDDLNHSPTLAVSELAPTTPEETRRSFHGHSHESCPPPLHSGDRNRAMWVLFASESAMQGCSCHGTPQHGNTDSFRHSNNYRPGTQALRSQNGLRNGVNSAQALPFPGLGIKSWPCGQLRTGRSPKRELHSCLHQEHGPCSAWGTQSSGVAGY